METLEMVEEYNKDGVCVRRTVNGYELPPDKEPSIQILEKLGSITKKSYMTEKEAERFGYIK